MTLKNEIFEGIAAYKALTPTTQDQYYNEMYKIAKKKRQDDEKVDTAEQDAIKQRQGEVAGIPVPKMASTSSPGTAQVSTATPQAQALTPEIPPIYRRGGRVANVNVRRFTPHRFERGGPVLSYAQGGSIFEPDNPADMVIAQILRDPKADLGQFAPRPPPQQPVNPPPPVDPETASRIAAEGAPNTRARQGALSTSPPPTVPPSTEQLGPNLPTEQYGPPPLSPRQAATVEAQARGRAEEAGAATAQQSPDLSTAIAAAGGEGPKAPPAPQQAVATTPPPPPGGVLPGAQAAGVLAGQTTATGMPPNAPTPAAAPAGAPPSPRGSAAAANVPAQPGRPPGMPEFEGSPVIPQESSSAVGRGLSQSAAAADYKLQQELHALEREKLNTVPSQFEATYPAERQERAQKAAALDQQIEAKKAEIAQLRGTGGAQPAAPGATTPAGASKAPAPPAGAASTAAPGAPSTMGPSLQQMVVNRELNSREARAGAINVNQVPPKNQPKTNGPATSGNNTPGGSPGSQPAPPRAASASQPYTPQTAPKGSLGDQTRVAAYDPVADAADSRNIFAVNTSGGSREATGPPTPLYTNADITTTMRGAMSEAPKNGRAPVPGEGAASRPVLNAFVQAHNQGGRLEPGDALLVGMTARYKELLRQGRQKEAATAAWGLIQAANLEAATRGRVMQDQINAGDFSGAMKTGSQALGYLPDGMQHRVGPDGKSFLTIDPRTGQVTATTPMNGQLMLQLALGLSDGSMLWQTLQQTVASLTPPDKDAGNRQLRGQLLEEQIIGARQRNARGAGGGGKPSQVSGNASEADAILQKYSPQVAQTSPGAVSAPGYLSVDYVPPEPGQDNA